MPRHVVLARGLRERQDDDVDQRFATGRTPREVLARLVDDVVAQPCVKGAKAQLVVVSEPAAVALVESPNEIERASGYEQAVPVEGFHFGVAETGSLLVDGPEDESGILVDEAQDVTAAATGGLGEPVVAGGDAVSAAKCVEPK